jgi:hypothetical protein
MSPYLDSVVLEAILLDSDITVPVEVFEQKLKQKYPQRASALGDGLVAAFVQDNPQYRVTYDGVKAVSVSWRRTPDSTLGTATPATVSTPALEDNVGAVEPEQRPDQKVLSSPTTSDQPREFPTGHADLGVKPQATTVNRRKRPRIPCRKTRAYIITDEVSGVVVDVVDISLGGLCFVSFEQFRPHTAVSIATHYMEGGQNIFQNGLIVRVRHKGPGTSPTEYAVEFSHA